MAQVTKKGPNFLQGLLAAATVAGIVYNWTSKEDRQDLLKKGKDLVNKFTSKDILDATFNVVTPESDETVVSSEDANR
ncbi:hypothetical protein ACVR05_10240 [Streptococcus caprae]|uniref:YtxH domain-containing protein n=1 Tax=Streptococcus caprae TaxID=1640501 RepID=A0ABV8CT12_9STRE